MASQAGAGGGTNSQNRYTPSNPPGITPTNDYVKSVEAMYEAWVSQLEASGTLCLRPAYGTKGKVAQIWANYFDLHLRPEQTLFKYDIIVEPKAKGHKLHRVVELLLEQPYLSQLHPFTDFKKTLVLREDVPDQTVNVHYFPEDQNQPGPQAPTYHVRTKQTNVLVVQQFLDALKTASKSYDYMEPMFHALNTMLHHYPRSLRHVAALPDKGAFPLSGNLSDIHELGGGLQAARGFFSSVRPAAGRLLVIVNITWKAFYKPGPLHELHFRTFANHTTEKAVQAFGRSLEGMRVSGLHRPGHPPRSIWGLATTEDGISRRGPSNTAQRPPQVAHFAADSEKVKFWFDAQNRYVTVREYFEKAFSRPLKHPSLPVVNVGSKGVPVYWPPELCVVAPGQPARGLLNPDQTIKMLKCAVRKPADNFALIEKYGTSIVGLSQPSPFVNPNYVRIGSSLLGIEGRFISPPKLRYSRDVAIQNAAWNARGHRFGLPGTLRRWTWSFIEVKGYIPAFKGPNAASQFNTALKDFHIGLAAAGLTVQDCIPGRQITLQDEEDKQLEAILEKAAQNNFDFVWIVVPSGMKTLYDRIKYLGDVKFGLATLVSVDKKVAVQQGRAQYFGNEALKLNLKLNGRNQTVASPLYFVNDGETMILGADATHGSIDPRKSKHPSIAAVVMCDKYLARYHSTISVQNKRQEMIPRLGSMVEYMLHKWKANHGTLPRNIVFYRDGVSEGQYDMVRKQELAFIKNACGPIYATASLLQPRITVIIVTKRHHTRFAPKYDADNKGNCRNGLVVDRGITDMKVWSFFLQSHSTLQGAARPGYYVVIHDEIFRSYAKAKNLNPADVCQDLTQSLCYTFGRATRAVGICTPAYYADILCDRANCYIRAAPDHMLENLYDETSTTQGGAYQISDRDRDRLQALVQTHPRLEDTMFFI